MDNDLLIIMAHRLADSVYNIKKLSLCSELKKMPKKTKSIPVNTMADKFGAGIAIGKAKVKGLRTFKEADYSHRDEYHLFFLQEEGATSIEVDFQKHKMRPSSVIYIHPNQVHCFGPFENITASFWVINNENLNFGYSKILEEITPAKPIQLSEEIFSIISETVSLCIKLSERKQDKLYHLFLKDSCNTLVMLVVSQYLEQGKSFDKLSRFEIIAREFKSILEHNFTNIKKPTEYAQILNITTVYLNECVKKATGKSVSSLIHERVILEAKRLLYHSSKSVKQIAVELGYDDCSYFSRVFSKATGMTALAFRRKNLE